MLETSDMSNNSPKEGKFLEQDSAHAPDFYKSTIHARCVKIINKTIKKKECRTEIRFRQLIRPYLSCNANIIKEVYSDMKELFLKQGMEINFHAFNPGSQVVITYLTLTSAPDSFVKIASSRIKETILEFIQFYESYATCRQDVQYSSNIFFRDIIDL